MSWTMIEADYILKESGLSGSPAWVAPITKCLYRPMALSPRMHQQSERIVVISRDYFMRI
jgi:hypothetical protein